MKYQDRILFGKDSEQPEEHPYYWRVFKTNDDYFDYYRPYQAFWNALWNRVAGRSAKEDSILGTR